MVVISEWVKMVKHRWENHHTMYGPQRAVIHNLEWSAWKQANIPSDSFLLTYGKPPHHVWSTTWIGSKLGVVCMETGK